MTRRVTLEEECYRSMASSHEVIVPEQFRPQIPSPNRSPPLEDTLMLLIKTGIDTNNNITLLSQRISREREETRAKIQSLVHQVNRIQAICDMKTKFTARAEKTPHIITVNSMTLTHERSVDDIIAEVEAEEAAELLKSEGFDRFNTEGDHAPPLSSLVKENNHEIKNVNSLMVNDEKEEFEFEEIMEEFLDSLESSEEESSTVGARLKDFGGRLSTEHKEKEEVGDRRNCLGARRGGDFFSENFEAIPAPAENPPAPADRDEASSDAISGARREDIGARRPLSEPIDLQNKGNSSSLINSFASNVPFPAAMQRTRPLKDTKEMFETFRNVEENQALREEMSANPRTAKFLAETIRSKEEQRIRAMKKKVVGEQISAIIQKRLPKKCDDPGMFSIPIKIGNKSFDRAMLDLGASINVLPSYLLDSLSLGPLVNTRVAIQLADRSNILPLGKLEDVLVSVGEFTYPADFYVLQMDYDEKAVPIILGRPFMRTANALIDVRAGSMKLECGGKTINFNIHNATTIPSVHALCGLDMQDPAALQHIISGMSELKLMKTDLGNCPTLLTLQGGPSSSFDVQDSSRLKMNSPQELKCGGVACHSLKAKPKKVKRHQEKPHPCMKILVKQVWRVKAPQASQKKKANRAKKPKKKCHQGLPPNAIKVYPSRCGE